MNLEHELFGEPGDPFEGHRRYQRVKNALALLGCGRSKLYQLIRTGRVRAIRLDGMTMVDLASVSKLFSSFPPLAAAFREPCLLSGVERKGRQTVGMSLIAPWEYRKNVPVNRAEGALMQSKIWPLGPLCSAFRTSTRALSISATSWLPQVAPPMPLADRQKSRRH
jgi:hypothetical protein